jgi:hypothetical protein
MVSDEDMHATINDILQCAIRAHDRAESNCVLISFDWINQEDVRSKSKLCFVDEGCGIMAVQVFLQVMMEGCNESKEDFSQLRSIIEQLQHKFAQTSQTLFASEELPKQ